MREGEGWEGEMSITCIQSYMYRFAPPPPLTHPSLHLPPTLTLMSGGQLTMLFTSPPCTANVCTNAPEYKSHSLTVKSAPPDTRSLLLYTRLLAEGWRRVFTRPLCPFMMQRCGQPREE